MRRPAQLYRDELTKKFYEVMYDDYYMYYYGWTGVEVPVLKDNNYDSHDFVSVNTDDEVIGYISYNVNYQTMSATQLGIITFQKGDISFIKDVYDAVIDVFAKYHMNRLSFTCFTENPAARSYKKFVTLFGGLQNAYYRQDLKLSDGQLHDEFGFEILAEDFFKSKGWLQYNERIQKNTK